MDIDKVLSDLSPTFADFLKTINSSAPALFSALEKITPNPSMVHAILEILKLRITYHSIYLTYPSLTTFYVNYIVICGL